MSKRRCAYAACGKLFEPKAPEQKTCSFGCARKLVPKVVDEDDSDGGEVIPHPKREARRARAVKTNRGTTIAEALDELRRINAARLRN